MTKTDIAKHIQGVADLSQRAADALLEQTLELLTTTLQRGEDITIPGFGTFRVRAKNARIARNPRTGGEVIISARRVVTFHASSLLKECVNTDQTGTSTGR
jgi:integration host factor subunit alpha